MPFNVVGADQPMQPLAKIEAPAESDPGPFPIPANPAVEERGHGDAHMLILQTGVCKTLRDLRGEASRQRLDRLGHGDLRSEFEQAATGRLDFPDAAGLPILPGLLWYAEVNSGSSRHAVRMTVPRTQRATLASAPFCIE